MSDEAISSNDFKQKREDAPATGPKAEAQKDGYSVDPDAVRERLMKSKQAPCLDVDRATRRTIAAAAMKFCSRGTQAECDNLVELVSLLTELDPRPGEMARFDALVAQEVEQLKGLTKTKRPHVGPAMQPIDAQQVSKALNMDGLPG